MMAYKLKSNWSLQDARSSYDDKEDRHDSMDSGNNSRGGSFDDDYDDQAPAVAIDLNKFLGIDSKTEIDVVQIDDGEEEDEDEYSDEEGEGDDEEEGEEYEDEEDKVDLGPGDEVIKDTPSVEEIKRQREYNKVLVKEKKRDLIQIYLHTMKHFSRVKTKNTLLGLKIISHVGEKQAIVEKYIQRERDEQERIQEQERLRKLHFIDSCAAFDKKEKEDWKPEKKNKRKKKSTGKNTRFSTDPDHNPADKPKPIKHFDIEEGVRVPDVSLTTLQKKFDYKLDPFKPKLHPTRSNTRQSRPKRRKSRKIVAFSFKRSKFLRESEVNTKRRNTDLMQLQLTQLGVKDPIEVVGKGPRPHNLDFVKEKIKRRSRRLSFKNTMNHVLAGGRKRQFKMTDATRGLLRSKSRMVLERDNMDQTIRLDVQNVDTENLNQFKFEFADPRLTAKQASLKLRGELLKLLQHRRVPISHRDWPIEIRGINFGAKNPYGRVSLNYTRLSHHEKEHPFTSYRVLLTNIAYFRTKEEKMIEKHRQNMVELEEERVRLTAGLHTILHEIIEGLRIWASLSGISSREKRQAKWETEQFIEFLMEYDERFLRDMLMELYETIYATEFALRRLSISEGKGEGAELHEFKDIMHCRVKLKTEHTHKQKSIQKYQRHSRQVLEKIHKTDHHLSDLSEQIEKMTVDMKAITKAVTTMIDGMYFCQREALRAHRKEKFLESEVGIYASQRLADDYEKLLVQIQDTNLKRIELRRQNNATVREINKILPMPMRWR